MPHELNLIDIITDEFNRFVWKQLNFYELCSMGFMFAGDNQHVKSIKKNNSGMFIGIGNPKEFAATFGKLLPADIDEIAKKDGSYHSLAAELIVSYIFQHWEITTRPFLNAALDTHYSCDVFGDIRKLRNVLQHNRDAFLSGKPIEDSMRLFTWLNRQHAGPISRDVLYTVIYAIGLEIAFINKNYGTNGKQCWSIPYIFSKKGNYHLNRATADDLKQLSKWEWYKYFIADRSQSKISDLEIRLWGRSLT